MKRFSVIFKEEVDNKGKEERMLNNVDANEFD